MSEKARRALGPDGAARVHGVFKRAARDAAYNKALAAHAPRVWRSREELAALYSRTPADDARVSVERIP